MSTLFWAALWTLALIIDNSETFASYPADATGYCVDITDKHAAPSAQGCSDGLASLDGRTKAARRATELVGNFERELGDGLSAVEKLNVRRAAMLVTIAETMAAQQLAGEPISIKQLVRADNVARRAVRDLALERRGKPGRPS